MAWEDQIERRGCGVCFRVGKFALPGKVACKECVEKSSDRCPECGQPVKGHRNFYCSGGNQWGEEERW